MDKDILIIILFMLLTGVTILSLIDSVSAIDITNCSFYNEEENYTCDSFLNSCTNILSSTLIDANHRLSGNLTETKTLLEQCDNRQNIKTVVMIICLFLAFSCIIDRIKHRYFEDDGN